jgi:hypothetical protein
MGLQGTVGAAGAARCPPLGPCSTQHHAALNPERLGQVPAPFRASMHERGVDGRQRSSACGRSLGFGCGSPLGHQPYTLVGASTQHLDPKPLK